MQKQCQAQRDTDTQLEHTIVCKTVVILKGLYTEHSSQILRVTQHRKTAHTIELVEQ